MRRSGLAIGVLVLMAASPAAAANPFDGLTRSADEVCFRRDYGAAHLRRNPQQRTVAMTVWIRKPGRGSANVGLGVMRRGEADALFLSAACEWQIFGRGGADWMESYRKRAGAGCITLAVPDVFPDGSAEEGGAIVLDPAADGRTLTAHLDETQSLVRRADRGKKVMTALGPADRVVVLRRTHVGRCEAVRDAVTAPEPGVRVR